jgi:hypothetical protein
MGDRRNFLRKSMVMAGAVGVSRINAASAANNGDEFERGHRRQSELSRRLKTLTGNTAWTKVGEVPMKFRTFHPQGMVKIGNTYFVSSVEIIVAPVKYPQPVNGYDRDTGVGRGHLFKVDLNGNLLADLPIGEGSVYHPGGCDFDGQNIWVPTAEYRPNSRGFIYRVDPLSMRVTKVLEYPDHLGGCSRNPDDNSVHAVNWGSRGFYRFELDHSQTASPSAHIPPAELGRINHEFYIDYQDNKYLGNQEMLYTGLNSYTVNTSTAPFNLGGLEIVDLETNMAIHQVPIKLWSPVTGLAMTNNPTTFELTANGVRGYFIPDDDTSVLYIYEAATA